MTNPTTSSAQDFLAFSSQMIQRVEAALSKALATDSAALQPLYGAMAYSMLAQSKRIRALLVYATGTALKVTLSVLDDLAVAIEMVHGFSLIHDDLPAMDNASLRRGQASCHIAWGESTAILAGDALLAYAFDILSQPTDQLLPADQIKMIQTLSAASGAKGMTGGQYIDINLAGNTMSYEALTHMHQLKTGRLIEAAVQLAFLASTSADDRGIGSALTAYAAHLGLAFQIKDDLLDAEGSAHKMGKATGQDNALGKNNFIAMVGVDGARQALRVEHEKALSALSALASIDHNTRHLAALADLIVCRDH